MLATYPYASNDRLNAAQLDRDLEFSPGANPPKSRTGVGAGRFKFWIDTSGALPVLRQCVVSSASATYVAADWIAWGVVDAPNHKFHFDPAFVDFAGGSGGSFPINGVVQATGPTGGLAFNDQTVGGQNWIWYATGGQAYLDSGSTHRITVNFANGTTSVAGDVSVGTLTTTGTNAAVFMADRANPTTVTWGWYAAGNIMNLWRNDGTIPFKVESNGAAWIAGNQIIRAGDGATQFQSNLSVANDLHVYGNTYSHNQLSVTNQATVGGSVVTGGDLYLNRTSDPYGYILRPNIGGYNNLRFSTTAVTQLNIVEALTNNFYINSNGGYPLYLHANTGHVRVWTVRDGVRAWSAGTLDTGHYMIGDESAGAGRLVIDMAGATQLHGTTAWPLYSDSPSSYCLHQQTATGVRSWSSGVYNDGSYVIRDETAGGVARFLIDTFGTAIFNGQVYSKGSDAIYYFQDRTFGSYWAWYAQDGNANLYWTEYGNLFTFNNNGNFTTPGSVTAGSVVSRGNINIGAASVNDFYIQYNPGGDRWFNWASGCLFQFQLSTGYCWYTSGGAQTWIMTQGICFNAIGNVGGHGAYADLSDRRFKETVNPSSKGLAEILQLQPVEFIRVPPPPPEPGVKTYPAPERYWELGFVAQDVAPVLPEAVTVIPLPDGDALAVTSSAIVAAMVNAIKTLDQRLQALEV